MQQWFAAHHIIFFNMSIDVNNHFCIFESHWPEPVQVTRIETFWATEIAFVSDKHQERIEVRFIYFFPLTCIVLQFYTFFHQQKLNEIIYRYHGAILLSAKRLVY